MIRKQNCSEHEEAGGEEIQIAPGSGTSPVSQTKQGGDLVDPLQEKKHAGRSSATRLNRIAHGRHTTLKPRQRGKHRGALRELVKETGRLSPEVPDVWNSAMGEVQNAAEGEESSIR